MHPLVSSTTSWLGFPEISLSTASIRWLCGDAGEKQPRVDVQLGEIIHGTGHAQVQSVLENVLEKSRFATPEEAGDDQTRQGLAIRRGEDRALLVALREFEATVLNDGDHH